MTIRGLLRHVMKTIKGTEGALPEPGTDAPSFSATDHRGEPVSLRDLAGKWVVLWFFPKADTPG